MHRVVTVVSAGVMALLGAAGPAGRASAEPVGRVGVMGDSLSNEYAEGTAPYAKMWVELLAELRGVDLGPTAAQAGVGGWPDIRGGGHQEVYARGGATTDTMVLEGQHLLARAGITQRGVTHVVICPSGNDFSSWLGPYSFYYYDQWTPARSHAFVDGGIENVRTLVTTARDAGAHVLLATMPDFGGVMPLMHGPFSDPIARARATAAVGEFNRKLRAMAEGLGVPVVDLQALNIAVFGTNSTLRTVLPVGGVNIRLRQRAGPGEPADTGFVLDGVHFHTVIHGLWANAIVAGLNREYGANIPELTEAEILAAAGLTYGGHDTLRAVIGPFSAYTGAGPCRADYTGDGTLDLLDIFAFLRGWFGGDMVADYNQDALLDVADIFAFLTVALGQGCP